MPDNEERLNNSVALLKEILQVIEHSINWEVLLPTAFFSSAILLLCHIPSVAVILSSMFEIVRSTSALVLMFTLVGISYKCIAGVFFYTKAHIEKHMLQKYTIRLQQEKEAAEISEAEMLVDWLPERELRILKYMYDKGGITWLPVKDGAVLNLYDAQCIYPAISISMLRGELLGENAQCFACKLNPVVERNITKLNNDFLNRWAQLEPASWLSVYEQRAE